MPDTLLADLKLQIDGLVPPDKLFHRRVLFEGLYASFPKSLTRNSSGGDFGPRQSSHDEEGERQLQPCERRFNCRFEVL